MRKEECMLNMRKEKNSKKMSRNKKMSRKTNALLVKLLEKVETKVSRIRKWIAGAYAVGMCAFGFALPVFASNPGEAARTMVVSWLQPIVYVGMAVFGALLLFKRRFTEFFGFVAIALIAVALIFYPENIKNFLGQVVQTLFP